MQGISGLMRALKGTARATAGKKEKDHVITLMGQLEPDLQPTLQLASVKGALSWLTCRPLRGMTSPCTRVPSVMPYASGVDGILLAYLQHARGESHS